MGSKEIEIAGLHNANHIYLVYRAVGGRLWTIHTKILVSSLYIIFLQMFVNCTLI